MRKSKKIVALALAAIMAVSAFAGCGGDTDTDQTTTPNNGQQTTTTNNEPSDPPYELSILLPYGNHEHDELDLTIEWRNRLESYTNTKITWEMYAADAYYEALTLKYASGELATIMVTDKNAAFQSACQYNTFWALDDYLDLFENHATIPMAVRKNASQNGKLYGIPRSRDVGRNACAYRQDWADNLGIKHPETIQDLYEMAVAFTNDDPDGNGKNDTYGFGLDMWDGQWDIMLPWFGVHNKFGLNENGELEYMLEQDEWRTALKTFRQWNSEGLINEGWETLGAGSAEKSIFRTNIAGIAIQVADSARKSWDALVGTEDAPGTNPEASFTYFGAVEDGVHGYHVLPTDGFSGYVAVTKTYAPTTDDLMAALQFLNDINDAEMRNLIEFGLEGKDYEIDENGYGVRYDSDKKAELGISSAAYREGYNQMISYFQTAEEAAKNIITDPSELSAGRQAEAAIKEENMQYVLPNEGAGFTSPKYVEVGEQLDTMYKDMVRQYILGEIDDTGLEAAVDTWFEAGGQQYIDDIKAEYNKAKAN